MGEAMQLMVEGDKWEMYIPMELAYGPNGKPPKIPPAACLVFIMEIVKIKGATVPAAIDFPEWTEEQLKLWEEKDEAQITKWVEAKERRISPCGSAPARATRRRSLSRLVRSLMRAA